MADNEQLTSGTGTSEYVVASGNNAWSIVGTVLGLIIVVGGTVGAAFGTDTKYSIIVGGIVTVASQIQRTLVSLGYIKSRAVQKVEYMRSVSNK